MTCSNSCSDEKVELGFKHSLTAPNFRSLSILLQVSEILLSENDLESISQRVVVLKSLEIDT